MNGGRYGSALCLPGNDKAGTRGKPKAFTCLRGNDPLEYSIV